MVTKKRKQTAQVRIIAGEWRGRKLPVVSIAGLRPTPDRVRETLFNWLHYDLAGRRCLDAFAGTGALGAEALSRGAKEVVFIESDPLAFTSLSAHLLPLAGKRAQCIAQNALNWLAQAPVIPFDLVFLDPPFAAEVYQPCLDLLLERGWLADQALIYIEQNVRQPSLVYPTTWQEEKTRQAGEVRYSLWRVQQ